MQRWVELGSGGRRWRGRNNVVVMLTKERDRGIWRGREGKTGRERESEGVKLRQRYKFGRLLKLYELATDELRRGRKKR